MVNIDSAVIHFTVFAGITSMCLEDSGGLTVVCTIGCWQVETLLIVPPTHIMQIYLHHPVILALNHPIMLVLNHPVTLALPHLLTLAWWQELLGLWLCWSWS